MGAPLIVAGTVVGLASTVWLRPKAPTGLTTAVLAICAAAIGAGALLLQDATSPADWVFTLLFLGVGAPLLVRGAFGPFRETETHPSGTVGPDRKR